MSESYCLMLPYMTVAYCLALLQVVCYIYFTRIIVLLLSVSLLLIVTNLIAAMILEGF